MTTTSIGFVQTLETPDGAFTLITNEREQVLASGWTADSQEIVQRIHPSHRPAQLESRETDAAAAVTSYYAGDPDPIMQVPVAQWGTEFQQQGWLALRNIMPGEPLSYTDFAVLLGRPTAVRAVASICARNAAALFVPCHRVLRNDGGVGGFAWGTSVKHALLNREAALLPSKFG